ncbi:uncharacterized protein LOC110895158 [Helianthus annuus]|uniref:uncharacterized protein LOC110895158 n=1 Tax=Helianthus annuus TaxID=4232 RepID=UPI001653183F|nr:uncharacterized protein LOC110895158 [Helianthus annuus]
MISRSPLCSFSTFVQSRILIIVSRSYDRIHLQLENQSDCMVSTLLRTLIRITERSSITRLGSSGWNYFRRWTSLRHKCHPHQVRRGKSEKEERSITNHPRQRRLHPNFSPQLQHVIKEVISQCGDVEVSNCSRVGGLRCWRDRGLGLNCTDGC